MRSDLVNRENRVKPFYCLFVGLLGGLLTATACAAQQYPQRPVRIVVPVSAGGGVDTLARIVGEHLSVTLGQRFIVDNRPGAGTAIGAGIVAQAAPDGHTLMVSSSSFVTNAAIQTVRYDPVTDFRPITKLTANPYIIVTTPSLPVSSVKDLIALARSKPGRVTYASSGTGGIFHLGSELLCVLAGVQMTHVPFKGVADGYPAVISGQVNWIFGSPISALPLIRAGRLKGIAVTSAARSRHMPELPTVAESGLPGYAVDAWFGFFAPARTPASIVDRLHAGAARAMAAPDIGRRMEAEATTIAVNPPKVFAAEVKAEFEKWRGLVAKAGLKI
jgi:tripartite-type tricarboxylate transporter receptor subunit TctC